MLTLSEVYQTILILSESYYQIILNTFFGVHINQLPNNTTQFSHSAYWTILTLSERYYQTILQTFSRVHIKILTLSKS